MGQVRDLAEALWSGSLSTADAHPFTAFAGLEEYRPGLAFVSAFANVVAASTGEGLVLIDTGSFFSGEAIREQLRAWSTAAVHTAVYTHGHIDHATGIGAFEAEARPRGAAPLRVVAHRAVGARFERYRLTAGYNASINARQFRFGALAWPTEYRAPDAVYDARLDLDVGGVRFELHHARGETDDHTWLWLPEHRAVCTGDLFLWASPNCGNPQKVQRYPRDQAEALERMAALDAELLLPGHGPPIEGASRVREALTTTAALLRSLHDQTVARMNEGASLDQVLASVRAPAELLGRPWLRPVYDEPEFVVRNVWRLYGGWWDGDASRLKPARDEALALEVAALSGGAAALAARAEALSARGEHALACHLVEWAARAAPADLVIAATRAEVYTRRAATETSLMACSIYHDAAGSRPR
ncbi:MAG: MBL fold metallo-hydrolase [Deltaproteobacteria bacterium]|nr:MBL fold metallo-hydrolase [Deltaproteobacteria bacterium]